MLVQVLVFGLIAHLSDLTGACVVKPLEDFSAYIVCGIIL